MTSFVCHTCFEAVTSTGPRGRGDASVALLRTGRRAYLFCSAACRTWWVTVAGNEILDGAYRVADGVPLAAVEALA